MALRLTPQEQRRAMIEAMDRMLFNATKDDKEVEEKTIKDNFMYLHGSSKTRTNEYFDLVINVTLRDNLKRYYYFVIDGKVSRSSKEEQSKESQPIPQQPHP